MIQWLSFESQALAGFPMNDTLKREFPVYLPPHYDSNRAEPYPLVVILAGWGGKGSGYIADDSAFGLSLPKLLDRAILDGRLKPAVVAFPDGTSKLGGSQYINSPAFGNYSDYICDELVSFLEKHFRITREANFRGLMGHSSGGFGALVNGMMRPDRFEFICSSAGDSFFEVSLLPLITTTLIELEKAGSLVRFLDDYLNHPSPKSLSRSKGEALMLLSMAPCYAPDPSSGPLYGKLFFDIKTGAVISDIWNQYLAWDPIRMAEKYKSQLKKLKFIQLCSGQQDEYCLQFGHRQLAQKFQALGISHEVEEYPGTHSGHTWRFESRLIKMINAMMSQ